jgi:hypothetical protein
MSIPLSGSRSAPRMARELGNARTLGWIAVSALIHAVIIGATSVGYITGSAESEPVAAADTSAVPAGTSAAPAPVAKAAASPAAAAPAAAPKDKPAPAPHPANPTAEAVRKVMRSEAAPQGEAKPSASRNIDDLLNEPSSKADSP